MSEWSESKLNEVISLQRGHDLPDQKRRHGEVPIVGSFGITGWHDEAKSPGPGVTIGRSGASIGRAVFVDCDYWPLNTCLYVTDFKGNEPRWVYHMLDLIDFTAYNSGSAQPSLNRNYLAQIPINVPPVDEQRQIAAVLGALDDLVKINRMLIELLWKRALSAYERAASIAEKSTLGEHIRLLYGRALPARDRIDGPFPVVSSAGVVDRHHSALVKGPGVVVGRKGTVGSVTWVFDDFFPIDTTFYVEADLSMLWVYFALRDGGLTEMNTDSAVPGLNRENALGRPMRLPKPDHLDAFTAETQRYLSAIRGLTAEVDDVTRVRGELLPLLMSNKVRILKDLTVK